MENICKQSTQQMRSPVLPRQPVNQPAEELGFGTPSMGDSCVNISRFFFSRTLYDHEPTERSTLLSILGHE